MLAAPLSYFLYFIRAPKPLGFSWRFLGAVNNDAVENIPLIRNCKQSLKGATANLAPNPHPPSLPAAVTLGLKQ